MTSVSFKRRIIRYFDDHAKMGHGSHYTDPLDLLFPNAHAHRL